MPKEKIFPSLFYHLIPFFLDFVFLSVPLSMRLGLRYFSNYISHYDKISDYLNLIENAYFFVYILLTYKLLRKVKASLKNHYSHIDEGNLTWFEFLLIGIAIIITADSLFSIYELYYPIVPWNIGTIIAFMFVILYVYLGYKGIFQSRILLPEFLNEVTLENHVISNDKQIKNQEHGRQLDGLSQDEIEELKIKLDNLLNKKKLFLNDSLSLTDLADAIGIGNKKLSELLNQHLNISFYNLINDYRIEEVKHRMNSEENDKLTLLGIAFESGFQSKASFNRVFKSKTGMSPSMYKYSILKERNPPSTID
ncbi:helix-turn-helix domain-containing protein [Gelidibacter algens]|uniref:helix-turn-helix domain-containing protein n=1 Tax=Gelidibacter algens TaxID=49280 RepID=UPI001472D74D|nr:helix-turn-helix domain-containing protein [Gelidibacter algens]